MHEYLMQVEVPVTPQDLLSDNRSLKAQLGVSGYMAAKGAAELVAMYGCSDARADLRSFNEKVRTAFLGMIAAAGNPEPFRHLFKHEGVGGVVVSGHHSGETVKDGCAPGGCGGLGEKGHLVSHMPDEHHPVDGVLRYVQEEIAHPDVLIQSIASAREIARFCETPVLAATTDHLTGLMYPLAVFMHRGRSIELATPAYWLEPNRYNPAEIYEHGIPRLRDNQVPDIFLDLLEKNVERVRELMLEPNFAESQRVQNPGTLLLATSPIQAGDRYPGLYGRPNTAFKLHLPIHKSEAGVVTIPQDWLSGILVQTQYPVMHTNETTDRHKPFGRMDRVVIETPTMDMSREVARSMMERPWMQDWLKDPRRKVIITQVQSGNTQDADYLQQ